MWEQVKTLSRSTHKVYRSEFFNAVSNGRTVLGIALDVKMTAEETLFRSLDFQKADVNALVDVLESWKTNVHNNSNFDRYVKKLLVVAIQISTKKFGNFFEEPK